MSIDLLNGSAVMATVQVVAKTAAEFIGTSTDGVFVIPSTALEFDAGGAFSRSFRRVDDELAATLDGED